MPNHKVMKHKKMTPELLEAWSGRFEIATVALTLITAFCGLFAWRFATWSEDAKDAQLKKFQTEAQVAIAKSEEETAKARLELEKMKEAQLPRKLTQDMRIHLTNALKPFSGQKIFVSKYASSTEATAFSDEIESALKDAGWVVANPGIWISPALEPGVLVFISQDQATFPAASELVKSLTECGFVVRYVQEDRKGLMGSGPLKAGEIGMLVCPK